MVKGSIYGLNTASCLGKWRQANMNIKVMMFFKATQKFFQSSWLALESHKFLPIYTPFGEEAI